MHSRNHCCRGKVINITNFVCVCVCVCVFCARQRGRVLVCVVVGARVRAYTSCSLPNPAYNAPPYCHPRPLWLHNNFRHFLINGKIFGNKLLQIKCAFWFSLQLLFETFIILRRIQRDIVINIETSSCKAPVILCRILVKLEFSRHILGKSSNIKFHQNTSTGSRVVPFGQTDRQIWRR
jgi:hypothetical protein